MKCPICKNELEIKSKKVKESANGESIYNEFAICHNCKKQWNLDKQRAKQSQPSELSVEKAPAEKVPAEKVPVRKSVKKPATEKPATEKSVEGKTTEERPKKRKKRPVVDDATKVLEKCPPVDSAQPESDVPSVQPAERPKMKKRRPAPETVDTKKSTDEVKPVSSDSVSAERPKKKKRRPAPETAGTANPVKTEERPKKKKRPAAAIEEKLDDKFLDLDLDFDDEDDLGRPKKRKPIDNRKEERTLSNIPPKHVREKSEKEVRQNYQMMLDEDAEEEGSHVPTILIVILILLILAAAAFAGYWFLLR